MSKLVNLTKRPWKYEDIKFWKNQDDGVVNACIKFNGKNTRLRAGILIVKDDTVLLGAEKDTPDEFSLPGGSLEKGESVVETAVREAQEEVFVNVKNAIDTELDYCECEVEIKDWVKENVPEEKWWYNYYTCLCIGEYDSEYKGKVDKEDLDISMKNTCEWYKIEDVIDSPTFKEQWKNALIKYGFYKPKKLKESLLTEDSRRQIIDKAKKSDTYKDTSKGKNRYERRLNSTLIPNNMQYNKIDMNRLFRDDTLVVNLQVRGETSEYVVTVKIKDVLKYLSNEVYLNDNKVDFRCVLLALQKAFDRNNVYISCSCPDFRYRIAFHSSKNDTNASDVPEIRPSDITNPNDTKGASCKHINLILSNMGWLFKVASVINNYISYAESHLKKQYDKLIKPKIHLEIEDKPQLRLNMDKSEEEKENKDRPKLYLNNQKPSLKMDVNKEKEE